MRPVAIVAEAGVHLLALCLIHHFNEAQAVDTAGGASCSAAQAVRS